MALSSVAFLYAFLPAVLLLYFIAPKRAKTPLLLVSSLAFYVLGWGLYALVLLAVSLSDWLIGLGIAAARGKGSAGLLLALSAALDLAAVVFIRLRLPGGVLSLGLGVLALKGVGYNIDLYRGVRFPEKNLMFFAAYMCLFPQLAGGLVQGSSETLRDLKAPRVSLGGLYQGIRRFCFGLGKTALIAGVLGGLVSDFRASGALSVAFYWIFALSSALGLYFQLSGLADMALGLGRMLGLSLPENFRYPLAAGSVTSLSRRWMITVRQWLEDRVCRPLSVSGGSRWRKAAGIFASCLVLALFMGLGLNFLLLGMALGLVLTVESLWAGKGSLKGSLLTRIYTFLFILLAAVLAGADGAAGAASDLGGLLGAGGLPLWNAGTAYYAVGYAPVIILAVIGATPLPAALWGRFESTAFGKRAAVILEPLFILAVLALSTAFLVDGAFTSPPFFGL